MAIMYTWFVHANRIAPSILYGVVARCLPLAQSPDSALGMSRTCEPSLCQMTVRRVAHAGTHTHTHPCARTHAQRHKEKKREGGLFIEGKKGERFCVE